MFAWWQNLLEAFGINLIAIEEECDRIKEEKLPKVKNTIEKIVNGEQIDRNTATEAINAIAQVEESLIGIKDTAKQTNPSQVSPKEKEEEVKQVPGNTDVEPEEVTIKENNKVGLNKTKDIDLPSF